MRIPVNSNYLDCTKAADVLDDRDTRYLMKGLCNKIRD